MNVWRLSALLALLALPLLGGCSYVCHSYQDFRLEPPPAGRPGEPWTLKGEVERFRPPDQVPDRGSWPHWPPRKHDRYRLRMVPVAADTTYWASGTVDLVDVVVIADHDTVAVTWAEVTDLPVKHADRRRSYLPRAPWPWLLVNGKLEFTAEFFELGYNLPDTLIIEGLLELHERENGSPPVLQPFRCFSVKETHVRWHIADAFES